MLSGICYKLFPELVFDLNVVEALLRSAEESSSLFFDIHDAVEDADGFVWPDSAEVRDLHDLDHLYEGDIVRLIRARQTDQPLACRWIDYAACGMLPTQTLGLLLKWLVKEFELLEIIVLSLHYNLRHSVPSIQQHTQQ